MPAGIPPIPSTSRLASTLAKAGAASTPSRPNRRPTLPVNKRVAASSSKAVLSSLIDLYHQTTTFAPLQKTKLDDYITPILAPVHSHRNRHKPLALPSLLLEDKMLSDRMIRYERQRGLSSLPLSSSHFSERGALVDDPKEPLQDGPLRTYVHGREHPLRKRVRQLIDAAHGTSSGGLAGLKTVEMLGSEADQWKQELKQAREATTQAKLRMQRQRRNQEQEAEVFAQVWEETDQVGIRKE